MKLNFEVKLRILFLILLSLCLGFNIHIMLSYKQLVLSLQVFLFSALVLVIYFVYFFIIRKQGQKLLEQLSNIIAALIDMRDTEQVSVLKDDMLSKLQSQLIKLSGILNMQNKRLKKERDDIKALISDISHQLKTPVSNLKIYCELLLDSSLSDDKREEFTNNIQGQLNKLSFLMDSMIKMSRLESGIIGLKPRYESLNKTCLAAIKQAYQKALQKNIEISFLDKGDILTSHDTNWTTEAVFNILDNAVKYTQPGGKVIFKIEKYEMYVRIDIIDNGLGILEADINNIFKRFFRGKDTLNEEGIGLGLYLAREIITKQEGYIKVSSEKGKGSKFSVFLPLKVEI